MGTDKVDNKLSDVRDSTSFRFSLLYLQRRKELMRVALNKARARECPDYQIAARKAEYDEALALYDEARGDPGRQLEVRRDKSRWFSDAELQAVGLPVSVGDEADLDAKEADDHVSTAMMCVTCANAMEVEERAGDAHLSFEECAWRNVKLHGRFSPAPKSTEAIVSHAEAMQVDSAEEEHKAKLPRSDARCVSKTDGGPTVEDIRKRKRADVNECMDDPSPCFPLAEYHMTKELARGALNEARERKDPDDPDDEIVALEVAYHEACALYKDARDELRRQLTAKRSKRGSAVLEHVDEMNAIANKDEISRRTDKMTRHALDDDDDDRRTNEAEQVRVALRFHQTGDPALRT